VKATTRTFGQVRACLGLDRGRQTIGGAYLRGRELSRQTGVATATAGTSERLDRFGEVSQPRRCHRRSGEMEVVAQRSNVQRAYMPAPNTPILF